VGTRSRVTRFAFSKTRPPQDEVFVLTVIVAVIAQFVLRAAASSTDYSLLGSHIPFGGVLDVVIAFIAAGALGLIVGLLGVRLYRALKSAVSRNPR